MTQQVWKFTIDWMRDFTRGEVDEIEMPIGAGLLGLQMQGDEMRLWVAVDPAVMKETRRFVVVGTGHEIPRDARDYVGTTQLHDGKLVLHVFEIR